MVKRQGNLGQTRVRRRRRSRDPMQAFDRLPPELRGWLARAALPWSPESCHAIWRKTRGQGASVQQALDRLTMIETAMLQRDAARNTRT